MSRLLKRVPMDFDWPLRKTWTGYVCPIQAQECECEGSGLNRATHQLDVDFYGLGNRSRRWCDKLTADEVQALVRERRVPKGATVSGVNSGSALGPFGHDAINRSILVEVRAKRLGVYGTCERCNGEGCTYETPEAKAAAEAWTKTEPPAGPGFQLWENCSEGSPISPVFASLQGLCKWAEKNATTFADERATAKQWEKMLSEDDVRHEETAPNGDRWVFC